MLTLYLILLAIAALGFIALTLIAVSYYKPKAKQYSVNNLAEEATEEEKTIIAIHEPIVTTPVAEEDSTLASLGFSALDTIEEPKPVIPVTTEFNKPGPQPFIHKTHPVVLYLLAPRDHPFIGYELLQALLSAELRFGEKRIFHRYGPLEGGQQKILFSVASAVEPGIFDMANIGGFSCPGLCIFMAPEKVADPATTFELMLETAIQLADDLGGELCNQQREPLTEEEIEEQRANIVL
jgi:cell division protein ZipA